MSRDLLAAAARRHSFALPGHILLGASHCCIPASVLTLDVLVDRVEDLEASQKYALRAVLNGIGSVEDLELFLGLDRNDTYRAVSGLLALEYLDYRATFDDGARQLSLLPAGLEAARDAQVHRPVSTSVQVVYDRLIGHVTDWRKVSLRRSAQARSDSDRLLIPPSRSLPVQLEDLTIPAVTSALAPTSRSEVVLLGINGVTENRSYYRDAILLVYKEVESDAIRLGVEIDDSWSEPHAAALDAIGAAVRMGISALPADDPYEPAPGPMSRLTRDQVIAIQAAPVEAGEQPGDDILGAAPIRWMGGYEHPQRLDDALANSKHRLLISSPQISPEVVSSAFIKQLEALARTADVTVVWGGVGEPQMVRSALDSLYAAALRSNRLAVVRVGAVRSKLLISDAYYVKTTYNWLASDHGGSREYRADEAELVQDQTLVDNAYDTYLSEQCAVAEEVVGRLPSRYRDLLGPSTVVREPSSTPPTRPGASGPTRTERQRRAIRGLRRGQIVSGKVKNLTNYGAFVGLGDIDGLIHISKMGKHVNHPSDVVAVGDKVTVLVLDVDPKRKRVSLALKES